MDSYINNNSNLNSFDYGKYLNKISFSSIKQLDIDREIANSKGLGDDFLYYLTDYFVKKYPPHMNYIDDSISIGESFLHFDSKKGIAHDEIYKIIGYYILSKCARAIEKDIAQQSSNWLSFLEDDTRIEKLRQRLKNSRINIKLKKDNATKVWDNVKSGNFGYIWDRFCKKFCNEKEILTKSRIKLKTFKVNNITDNNIFYLSKDTQRIGEIIWLERPIYKAHYFAKGNVYTKYKDFLSNNNLKSRIVVTGGYSNSFGQPEGLTIENGNIVNAVLMPDRDGLVIIEKNGGIRAINLKNGSFILPKMNGIKIDPLSNIIDYAKLIKWSKSNKATFFQTHLFAFSDKILINKKIANNQSRERRLLALGSHKKNGKVFHLIINIRKGVSLADITEKVFDLMKVREYKVEAILNLDVGSYDIMEVYDSSGQRVLNAHVPLSNATNLLFYTK
jgi:hypothetical protein